jgi:ferric-dicitrate binding protein FerR (iron transport regulator)
MTKLDKNRILNYLEQAERTQEHKYLVELFTELENHPEFSDFLKNDWNKIFDNDNNISKDLSGVLNKLHEEIEQVDGKQKLSFTKRLFNAYSRIAAILLLPLLAGGFYYFFSTSNAPQPREVNQTAEIHAPENARVKYILPDSSVVWLNSGSTIKYAVNFASNRHVDLTGKAFFDVTHDTGHPFSVTFPNGKVEVLGTKFSVTSNANGNFDVTLVEGKVRALVRKNNRSVTLSPNQTLIVNDTGLTVKNVNAENITAWINGKLIFRDTPFSEVARRLSDWYNVDIQIKDSKLKHITYRGIFKDESLDNVLSLMSMTLPIKYKKLPRQKGKDGKFQKQKILIYSNK